MKSKITRNGRSIVTDINKLPKRTLTSSLGFSEGQANRMTKVRKVLPLVEDRQLSCINARKLWEKIGKPHGRFRDWAEHRIKPLLTYAENSAKGPEGEIVSFYEQTEGRPRTNYLISRDVAANLAMMANTPEGHEVRQYFLDMEAAVVRLERYRPIRTEHLAEIDNGVYHHAVAETGSKTLARETERFLKGMAARAISGLSASEWRHGLNAVPGARGKGIRDVLDADNLKVYRDAYVFGASLIESGIKDWDRVEAMVTSVHGGKVDPSKYFPSRPEVA